MFTWTTSNKAINLCLVKDANLILADRVVYVLNKLVKTLFKYNKSSLVTRLAAYTSSAILAIFKL
jgi:hypothetical protein